MKHIRIITWMALMLSIIAIFLGCNGNQGSSEPTEPSSGALAASPSRSDLEANFFKHRNGQFLQWNHSGMWWDRFVSDHPADQSYVFEGIDTSDLQPFGSVVNIPAFTAAAANSWGSSGVAGSELYLDAIDWNFLHHTYTYTVSDYIRDVSIFSLGDASNYAQRASFVYALFDNEGQAGASSVRCYNVNYGSGVFTAPTPLFTPFATGTNKHARAITTVKCGSYILILVTHFGTTTQQGDVEVWRQRCDYTWPPSINPQWAPEPALIGTALGSNILTLTNFSTAPDDLERPFGIDAVLNPCNPNQLLVGMTFDGFIGHEGVFTFNLG